MMHVRLTREVRFQLLSGSIAIGLPKGDPTVLFIVLVNNLKYD